jgi:hypothetical protein
MELNDCQLMLRNYIDYPPELGPFSCAFSLWTDTGRLSEKMHKVLEEKHGEFEDRDKSLVAISISDILFDISNIAYVMGYTLDDVVNLQIRKQELLRKQRLEEQDKIASNKK